MSQSYKAAILGMAGETLTADEVAFFREQQPVGYILFQRNCASPKQVKALTDQLREIAGTDQLMILIDQEGGRVARLKPPHWRVAPSAAALSTCAVQGDVARAKRMIYLNARLIAAELSVVGVSVDCAPLADVPVPECHDIIGDRAYSDDANRVAELAREMSNGLLDGGILPVLKHIPGHGRALADSHENLPIVENTLAELRETDFVPFKALNDIPLGMTAHILYTAIDSARPATMSPAAVELMREELGFDGLLMSDDISMKALKGDFGDLTRGIIDAGCDVVLHCNGKMDEMKPIMAACPDMSDEANRRLKAAWAQLPAASADELAALESEFAELYEGSAPNSAIA